MKTISIVTATRAEYGLLKRLIKRIEDDSELDLKLVVTGTHLVEEFGHTVQEIEEDGVHIDRRIDLPLDTDSPVDISKTMANLLSKISEYFDETRPDGLVLLGDRYEMMAVCCAATNARIPIFHIHGGEISEGAVDEAFRHGITKMSHIHFASTEEYRKRIIQMGENPDRVFNVGALGVENAINTELMSRDELEQSISFDLGDRYAVGTYHPVTLGDETVEYQIEELLCALDRFTDVKFLFTKANADLDGKRINDMLQEYADKHDNMILYDSLGVKRYLSALKNALFVIGNSSSGLIETPTFRIPTINIGDRQKGRMKGETIIDCLSDRDSIENAIERAVSKDFLESIKLSCSPYGDGNTSSRILNTIKECLENGRIDLKKRFYDIDFNLE